MTESISQKVMSNNKSATYLLPLLGKFIKLDFSSLMVNCYIRFNRPMGIEFPIGILYDISGISPYEASIAYEIELQSSELFHRDFIVDNDYKLYVFKFPIRYITEYQLFQEGKYSEMSKEAKDVIINYTVLTYKYHPITEDIVGVLYKKKERKEKLEKMLGMTIPDDVELSSIMDIEKETFKFKEDE